MNKRKQEVVVLTHLLVLLFLNGKFRVLTQVDLGKYQVLTQVDLGKVFIILLKVQLIVN